MKLLIDTHYLLWMFMDTAKISDKVKRALTADSNEVYYSQASLIVCPENIRIHLTEL